MDYLSKQQQQQFNRQIESLPQDAFDELTAFLAHLEQKFNYGVAVLDAESVAWAEADLAGEMPEYDWGEAGIPDVMPVRFVAGEGFVVDEVT
jgi:hypothetical protein